MLFCIFAFMESRLLEILRQCPLFTGMQSIEIDMALAGIGHKEVTYDKQDIYTLAGMPCKYADIVISGVLVCRMASLSGKQVEVSRLRPGDMIAPAFIFAQNRAFPVSVEADAKTEVFRMSPADLRSMIDNDSRIRQNFIQTLSNIDVFLTQKMKILSLFTVREKVAYLLMERMGEQGSNKIHLYRSRQEIADSFGIQKFSLLRVLSDFEKEGAIRIDGRNIEILDRRKLK